MDSFLPDGKRLDMTTPTIARNASSGSTTYATESVYATASDRAQASLTSVVRMMVAQDGVSGSMVQEQAVYHLKRWMLLKLMKVRIQRRLLMGI